MQYSVSAVPLASEMFFSNKYSHCYNKQWRCRNNNEDFLNVVKTLRKHKLQKETGYSMDKSREEKQLKYIVTDCKINRGKSL